VYIRGGEPAGGITLRLTYAEWVAFRDGFKLGDFDAV
jgi:hypothetical protein